MAFPKNPNYFDPEEARIERDRVMNAGPYLNTKKLYSAAEQNAAIVRVAKMNAIISAGKGMFIK